MAETGKHANERRRTANINLWVKYFNNLKDPPSSKVYSGSPIYRTTLANQIGSNDREV